MIDKWAYSFNEENYEGSFDTKEEAIEEVKAAYPEKTFVHVGQLRAVRPLVDGSGICEQLIEQAYDECGEACENWLTCVDKKEMDELTAQMTNVFYEWCKEYGHLPDNFFAIKNSEQIDFEMEG